MNDYNQNFNNDMNNQQPMNPGMNNQSVNNGGYEQIQPMNPGMMNQPVNNGGYEQIQPMNSGMMNQPVNNGGYEQIQPMNPGMNNQPVNNGGYEQIQPMNNNVQPSVSTSENRSSNNFVSNLLKNKKGLIAGIAGAVIGVIVVVLLLGNSGGTGGISLGGHKNTTGSKDYKNSDVSLNCEMHDKNSNYELDVKSDVLYNFKDYKYHSYSKVDYTFNIEVSDEMFTKMLENLGYTQFAYDCTISQDGLCKRNEYTDSYNSTMNAYDVTYARQGNKVIVTYTEKSGKGQKISNNDKKEVLENLEDVGYTCK